MIMDNKTIEFDFEGKNAKVVFAADEIRKKSTTF